WSVPPANAASTCASPFGSAPRAIRKLKRWPSTSSRSYPVNERKESLTKMIGWPGSFASVNTLAHARRFSGDDERPKILAKALDSGFSDFLFFRLVFYFRHPLGRSIGGALGTGVYEAKEW